MTAELAESVVKRALGEVQFAQGRLRSREERDHLLMNGVEILVSDSGTVLTFV